MDLYSRTVADFYEELFEKLRMMDIDVKIHPKPNEMEPAIPFKENTINKTYEPAAANTLWQTMIKADEVFTRFRSEFIGKASPVHLFWGAFDLAVTRFSGRKAPLHPGGMPNIPLEVMQEAYSQEVSSAGFWPGSKDSPNPVFYSYVYPTPESFSRQNVLPEQAYYSPEMGEFFLNYASAFPAACGGVSEHKINRQAIDDSSRLAARRVNYSDVQKSANPEIMLQQTQPIGTGDY